jgi:hypothetical protein
MKRLALLLVALLAFTGFCVWWFSPTQVVKRRSRDLCQILTLEEGTPSTSRNIGAFQLDRLLQPQVELQIPALSEANGSFERAQISSAFSWLCSNAKETRMKLGEIESITVNGDHAEVRAKVDALLNVSIAQPINGPGDAIFTWKKAEDGWRLEKVSWSESTRP